MRHKVCLTDEAVRQIVVIGDYIAQDSPENALSWVEHLRAAVDTLGTFPERQFVTERVGPSARRRSKVLGIRISVNFGVPRVSCLVSQGH